MNSLKRFLIGLFSSSAVVGFVIINYYCFEVINYIPEGVSFGTSLANLAIALRIFIPLAVSVCFASYIFFLDDIRKSPGSDIKAYHIALVFIIGFVFIIFINDFLNARYFEKSFYKLFIAQGSVFILISALIWLLFVHLPDSVLGQNVLNASSYRTVGGINNHRSVIIIIFTLIISVVFYFWSYSLLGWRSINNFVINNMEVAGFRKSNVDLFLKKSGEEIVILSCAGCDKKLSGLSKVNKNKSDAEFTAILSHADILWSTGDKHYIGFCNKGEHVYAELPKDSYNVSYAHSQTRVAESMPCLKTEGEG
ncbi:hypothetical protein, partial [Pantoea anthophila]|uniref:hypothetical protein n=1 Tax=Pantoea anthophila TaxID=470931 RepID=UPI00289C574E